MITTTTKPKTNYLALYTPMGLCRIDNNRKYIHGWRCAFRHRGVLHQRWFSDIFNGGKDEARVLAMDWLRAARRSVGSWQKEKRR